MNKKKAFTRMAQSKEFKLWVNAKVFNLESADSWVQEQMKPENLKIEYL